MRLLESCWPRADHRDQRPGPAVPGGRRVRGPSGHPGTRWAAGAQRGRSAVDDARLRDWRSSVRWWVPIWSVLRSIPVSKNGRSRWRPVSPTWRQPKKFHRSLEPLCVAVGCSAATPRCCSPSPRPTADRAARWRWRLPARTPGRHLPTRVKSVPPGHLLDPALAIFERLDVGRQVARTEASLRNLGVRRGRRGARNRPRLGWEPHPERAQRRGTCRRRLSKPQIGERLYVSRQTVQTHLVHVFAKLDISSRAQIAGEAARREERTP